MTQPYTDTDVELVARALADPYWDTAVEAYREACRVTAHTAVAALAAAGRLSMSAGRVDPREISNPAQVPTQCAAVEQDRQCNRPHDHDGRHWTPALPAMAWDDGGPGEYVGDAERATPTSCASSQLPDDSQPPAVQDPQPGAPRRGIQPPAVHDRSVGRQEKDREWSSTRSRASRNLRAVRGAT